MDQVFLFQIMYRKNVKTPAKRIKPLIFTVNAYNFPDVINFSVMVREAVPIYQNKL